jgi:hypothetical protein
MRFSSCHESWQGNVDNGQPPGPQVDARPAQVPAALHFGWRYMERRACLAAEEHEK